MDQRSSINWTQQKKLLDPFKVHPSTKLHWPPKSIRKNSPQSLANPIPVWFLDIGKSPFTSGPSNTISLQDHWKTVWIDIPKAVIRYQTRPPSLAPRFDFKIVFPPSGRPRCGWQASIRKRGWMYPSRHSILFFGDNRIGLDSSAIMRMECHPSMPSPSTFPFSFFIVLWVGFNLLGVPLLRCLVMSIRWMELSDRAVW